MIEEIPDALEGERVDRVISMILGLSRSAAAKAVTDGFVSIDGAAINKVSCKVSTGQELFVDDAVLEPPGEIEADPSVDVDFAHVDEHVIVVAKKAGQIVHPGAGNQTGTVSQGVLASYPELRDVGQPERPGCLLYTSPSPRDRG